MGRVAKIGALPAMPPNVRWLVALDIVRRAKALAGVEVAE